MSTELRRMLGAASLVALIACASSAWAETPAGWVDPPDPADVPSSPPAPPTARATPAESASAPARAAEPEPAGRRESSRAARSERTRSPQQSARTDRSAEPDRSHSRSAAAAAPKRSVQAKLSGRRRLAAAVASRREVSRAERPIVEGPVSTRVHTVRQALGSGLVVMRLRTLEYPDGRRVNVLTKPDPDTMQRLLAGQ